MSRSIILSVTTDITYDQRMIRICTSLHENGYTPLLVGRIKKGSLKLNLPFKTYRLSCFFEKGKFFYLEYNLRLFFFLLFKSSDILCAIDLDSIIPNYLISKIKQKPLVYDAHEYFPEVIEVTNRPKIKHFWESIEGWIVPRLKYGYTVTHSIADIFEKKYGTPFEVIRNIRPLDTSTVLPIHKTEKNIIYAGALNAGRGLEETIEAMKSLPCKLILCGEGELSQSLRKQVVDAKLEEKVIFKGFIPPSDLQKEIESAYAGILVLKNEGLSYYYSLANKFFDYLHAGIPQISTNFPEYDKLNKEYHVAVLTDLTVDKIEAAIRSLLTDSSLYESLSENARAARHQLNWQEESKKLITFYDNIR